MKLVTNGSHVLSQCIEQTPSRDVETVDYGWSVLQAQLLASPAC